MCAIDLTSVSTLIVGATLACLCDSCYPRLISSTAAPIIPGVRLPTAFSLIANLTVLTYSVSNYGNY